MKNFFGRLLTMIMFCFTCALFSADSAKISDVTAFVTDNHDTQISWITSQRVPRGKIVVKTDDGRSFELPEDIVFEGGLRNHIATINDKKLQFGEVLSVIVKHEIPGQPTVTSSPIEVKFGVRPSPDRAAAAFKIPLKVRETSGEARSNWQVRSGVPFAPGVLSGPKQAVLLDASGKEVPATMEKFASWQDGSVKWLIVSFNADTTASPDAVYTLTNGIARETICPELNVAKILPDIRGVITLADGKRLVAVPENGKLLSRSSTVAYERVEFSGEFEGELKGVLWKLIATAYPNGVVQVDWRVTTKISASKKNFLVKSFYWNIKRSIRKEPIERTQWRVNEAVVIKNGVKQDTKKVFGYVSGPQGAVFVRDFAETYPKRLAVDSKGIAIGVLPELYPNYMPENPDLFALLRDYYWVGRDDNYIFPNYMNLTGSFSLAPAALVKSDKKLREHFSAPLFAAATPKYYCETGVFGKIYPVESGYFDKCEAAFAENCRTFLASREKLKEFGWMNYGDWFGERRWNWGNNEYDAAALLAQQFARTGDEKLFFFGLPIARHYSSIDIDENPRLQNEIVYQHSVGHVGGFYSPKDKRMCIAQKIGNGYFRGVHDNRGGHDTQRGNFYYACLTGDRDMWDIAVRATLAQALYFTPDFKITIERTAGWSMLNACTAYFHTGNPVYLNALKIYFEKVRQLQNPVTGGMDLPQNPHECSCPDKKSHRGGKAFAAGVLMSALCRYYDINPDPEIKKSLNGFADWILNYAYDKETGMIRYKTGCPAYKRATKLTRQICEGLSEVSRLSGKTDYREFMLSHYKKEWETPGYKKIGKEFAFDSCFLPELLGSLRAQGVRDFPEKGFDFDALLKTNNHITLPQGIVVEAESFASERGGSLRKDVRKLGISGACVTYWDSVNHEVVWKFKAPTGRYRVKLRYAGIAHAERRLFLDGKDCGASKFTNCKGKGNSAEDWVLEPFMVNGKPLIVDLTDGEHEIKMVNIDDESLNLDFILLVPVK